MSIDRRGFFKRMFGAAVAPLAPNIKLPDPIKKDLVVTTKFGWIHEDNTFADLVSATLKHHRVNVYNNLIKNNPLLTKLRGKK